MDFVEPCSTVVDQVGLNMAASQNIKLVVIYGTISAFSASLMGAFAKMIGQTLPTPMLIFFRFATSLILLLPRLFNDPSFKFSLDASLNHYTIFRCYCNDNTVYPVGASSLTRPNRG